MILDGPALDRVSISHSNELDFTSYPFSLPLIQNTQSISFKEQVTFFVGENGSGKSTILEAIADKVGFGRGGSKHLGMMSATTDQASDIQALSRSMALSWRIKVEGYFFRAETFWDIANKLAQISKEPGGGSAFTSYGGQDLHTMSHGESFLALFKNRIGSGGIYILDEPEAALSPQRQLSLLSIMHELCKDQKTQFIIATHSPILLAYPNAQILSCDGEHLMPINYEDTEHYQITRNFLNNPQQYLRHLFI
jgi:predicted ATPase